MERWRQPHPLAAASAVGALHRRRRIYCTLSTATIVIFNTDMQFISVFTIGFHFFYPVAQTRHCYMRKPLTPRPLELNLRSHVARLEAPVQPAKTSINK